MTQKTILIIDDDLSIRKSLSNFFEDRDFIVFPAEDGQRGLDIFFKQNIDIVLTDLRMPKTDGIEVMRTIQHHNPQVPMIVVSGAGKEEDIIKALRMGAKDYITKPITDFNMIEHTVEKVLETSRLNQENKAYRKQIEKSEKRYRTITENIAEGVFTINKEGNFNYTNQAFCNMTGYSPDELLQKNLKDISTQESLNTIQEQIHYLHTGSASRYEIQMINKNSHYHHVELACSSILDDADAYQGMIAIARDITVIVDLRKKYKKFLTHQNKSAKDVTPICANCKDIKVKKGEWIKMENYFSTIAFSHGICPECCEKLYPDFDFSED